jgi:hypothetical protein
MSSSNGPLSEEPSIIANTISTHHYFIGEIELNPDTYNLYRQALHILQHAQIPFLVGGAYSIYVYTGIARDTKDLDIFLRPMDCAKALKTFAENGYQTEMTDPIWLAKAFHGDNLIDVIFNSGNGLAMVSDTWFEFAQEGEILGIPIRICPVEELILSKAFLMERHRYDGADIAHLMRACAGQFDWRRLITNFGNHWRVLLSHLILFTYIYPSERHLVPEWVINELTTKLCEEGERRSSHEKTCQGTLLSREQYHMDITHWGYNDARVGVLQKMLR